MISEAYAALSAFLFALAITVAKKGLKGSSPFAGGLVSVASNVIILWPLSISSVHMAFERPEGILFFLLGGLVATGFARLFTLMSVDVIGAAVTAPIAHGAAPLFAAIVSVIILKEVVTLPLALGTVLIASGVMVLSHERTSGLRLRSIGLSIVAASLFGLGAVLRKMGLNLVGSPVLGAAVGATAALFIYGVYWGSTNYKIALDRRSLSWFLVTGVCSSIALILRFTAYNLGQVVNVEPLANTSPLFVPLLSALLLKGVEVVTSRTMASALLIVSGSILIVGFAGST